MLTAAFERPAYCSVSLRSIFTENYEIPLRCNMVALAVQSYVCQSRLLSILLL